MHYIAGNYNFGLKKIEILTHKEEIASSTFKNFKDISIRFKNSFTITEDNKSEIAETGILLSKINDETNENIVKIKNLKQSYSETDFNSIVTGLNAHKSVNTSLKDNYLIALNVPNDKLIDKVFAVSYMKDNNNQYYFNNYKLMSVKDILDGYLDMEGEQIQFDDGSSVSLSDLALSCEIDLGL